MFYCCCPSWTMNDGFYCQCCCNWEDEKMHVTYLGTSYMLFPPPIIVLVATTSFYGACAQSLLLVGGRWVACGEPHKYVVP